MNDAQYKTNELNRFRKDMDYVTELPLNDRKEYEAEFLDICQNQADWFLDQCVNLVHGNYGVGSYNYVIGIIDNQPRMNIKAVIFQIVASLGFNTPQRHANKVWNALDDTEKAVINDGIDKIIADHKADIELQAI